MSQGTISQRVYEPVTENFTKKSEHNFHYYTITPHFQTCHNKGWCDYWTYKYGYWKFSTVLEYRFL